MEETRIRSCGPATSSSAGTFPIEAVLLSSVFPETRAVLEEMLGLVVKFRDRVISAARKKPALGASSFR